MELDAATELTVLARFYLGDEATVSFDREQHMILTMGTRRATSASIVQNSPRAVQFFTLGELAAEIMGHARQERTCG